MKTNYHNAERRRTRQAGAQRSRVAHDVEPLAAPDTHGDTLDVSLTHSFGTYHPSAEQIFDRLWANYHRVSRPKSEQLEGLALEVTVTAQQARAGGRANILVPARARCPECRGQGTQGLQSCWHCGGLGTITGEYPVTLSFPPNMPDKHVVLVPLERLGVRNLYLSVRFRVSDGAA